MATNNDDKARKARNKKIRSRFERLKQEDTLVDAMFLALTTMVEEHAVAWARRAKTLAEGLSAAALKRAQKRANKMADDMPPGHVKATEASDLFDEICRTRRISAVDQDTLWGAVAQVCMFQLASRSGRFYEAAVDFKLAPEPRTGSVVPVAQNPVPNYKVEIIRLRGPSVACGDPNCPNCRPRKPEELN